MSSCTTTEIVAREGWLKGFLFFLLFLFFNSIDFEFLSFVFILLSLFTLFLYRNIEKVPDDQSEGVFIAMIDGEIVSIDSETKNIVITIKNTILDAHILRMPIKSTVEHMIHQKGYSFYEDDLKNRLNQEAELTLKYKKTTIDISLKGIFFNKAISLYSDKIGYEVASGTRVGTFLSGEIQISLPKTARISPNVGDKIIGGQSVLAILK